MAEEEVANHYQGEIMDELSGIIYHKGKLLLKAITKKNIEKWFSQLMIKFPQQHQVDYFETAFFKFQAVLEIYKQKGFVDKFQAEELAKHILSVNSIY